MIMIWKTLKNFSFYSFFSGHGTYGIVSCFSIFYRLLTDTPSESINTTRHTSSFDVILIDRHIRHRKYFDFMIK